MLNYLKILFVPPPRLFSFRVVWFISFICLVLYHNMLLRFRQNAVTWPSCSLRQSSRYEIWNHFGFGPLPASGYEVKSKTSGFRDLTGIRPHIRALVKGFYTGLRLCLSILNEYLILFLFQVRVSRELCFSMLFRHR